MVAPGSPRRCTTLRALLPRLVVAGVVALVGVVGAPWRSWAAASPALTLDPARGPCGTLPRAHGAGFPASLPVLVQR